MVRSHKRQAIIGLLVALAIIIGNLVFPGLNVAPALLKPNLRMLTTIGRKLALRS